MTASGDQPRVATDGSREEGILEASIEVFLRYGFRKTSMDAVARAASLSRQGLYLHYPNRQALFRATVEHLISRVRAAALAALEREGPDLADRLADALTALTGNTAGRDGVVVSELLQETSSLSGPLLDQLHHDVVGALADLLRRSGVAALWQDSGLTADDLAEHLYLIPPTAALSSRDPAQLRRALHTAARIVTRGHPGRTLPDGAPTTTTKEMPS